MKKRMMTIAMIIGAAAMAMTGCGAGSVEGNWSVTEIQFEGMDKPEDVEDAVVEFAELKGQSLSGEEREKAVNMFTDIQMNFGEDGTLSVNQLGYGVGGTGTWYEAGDGVYVVNANGESLEVEQEGKKLIMEDPDQATKLIFEKN